MATDLGKRVKGTTFGDPTAESSVVVRGLYSWGKVKGKGLLLGEEKWVGESYCLQPPSATSRVLLLADYYKWYLLAQNPVVDRAHKRDHYASSSD